MYPVIAFLLIIFSIHQGCHNRPLRAKRRPPDPHSFTNFLMFTIPYQPSSSDHYFDPMSCVLLLPSGPDDSASTARDYGIRVKGNHDNLLITFPQGCHHRPVRAAGRPAHPHPTRRHADTARQRTGPAPPGEGEFLCVIFLISIRNLSYENVGLIIVMCAMN